VAGKHCSHQPPSAIQRTTGVLMAGAAMVGLAAGTARVVGGDEGSPRTATWAADASIADGSAAGDKAKGDAKEARRKTRAKARRKARRAAGRPTADEVIKLAEKQVGIAEDGNGETKFQDWYMRTGRAKETVARDGGSIGGYADAAWCSMFISWLGDQAGASDQLGLDAWTVEHAKWFQEQGRWGTRPKPGSVVFFAWSGGKKVTDIKHVGMVVKERRDGKVETVEGNSRNAVREQVRSAKDVVGYGYPGYAEK
jgi:CHAP domain